MRLFVCEKHSVGENETFSSQHEHCLILLFMIKHIFFIFFTVKSVHFLTNYIPFTTVWKININVTVSITHNFKIYRRMYSRKKKAHHFTAFKFTEPWPRGFFRPWWYSDLQTTAATKKTEQDVIIRSFSALFTHSNLKGREFLSAARKMKVFVQMSYGQIMFHIFFSCLHNIKY